MGVTTRAATAPTPVVPVVQGDWLASVCPYLASEDGTYRSAAPDEGHRCVAVEPAATLPLAFQERFCLTERHPRCEMYKFAQETGADGGLPIPAADLSAAATRPVRGPAVDVSGNRPALIAVAGVGGLAVLVLLVVLIMGSCSGGGGVPAGSSPEPLATDQGSSTAPPEATLPPEVTPAPESTPTPTPDADATDAPDMTGTIVLYEIQEGEALRKVSELFGVTRNRLRRDNPELEDVAPADMPGMIIEIPMPSAMTREEVEALDGFAGYVP